MDAVIQKTATPGKTERRIFIAESALWLVFVVAMVLKGIYFQFTTGLNTGSVLGDANLHMLLSTFISILLPLAILLIFFNRKRLVLLAVVDLIMTALLFADTQYFRYYYNAITIPVLHQIGFVSSIGESVESLLKWQDLIFVADIPILATGIILLIKLRGGRKTGLSLPKRLICSAIVLGVCFGLFQISWSSSPTYMFAYDNNYVIDNLGIFYFHYYDVKNYV